MILTGLIAARFAHYVALALAFGAVAYASFGDDGADASVSRRLKGLAVGAGVGVLVTALAVLAITAANMVGELSGAVDPGVWSAIVSETDFGRVWTVRLALAALLVAVVLIPRVPGRRRVSDATAILLAGGLVASVALTGHAQVESGLAGIAHRISDAVHLIAGAVWLGVLLPLLHLLWRPAGDDGSNAASIAARRLASFHTIGLAAVLALIASGLVNAWFLVGEVSNLFTTPYGQVLLVKVALFAVMVGFAADNRLRLVPALERARMDDPAARLWIDRLRGHIRAEFMLGVAVLLAVGVLGAIAPANEAM